MVTTILGRSFGLHSPVFVGSELALLVTMFAVSRYVLPLVDRHDRGATGEEHVGGLLDELAEEGWHVIHDASFGYGNVDHIALGKAGLFTIETKSRQGEVRVRSIHGAVLRQAQEQRETLERITGERADALVVFSRAWVEQTAGSPPRSEDHTGPDAVGLLAPSFWDLDRRAGAAGA